MRLAQPVLRRIARTWLATVFWLMNSARRSRGWTSRSPHNEAPRPRVRTGRSGKVDSAPAGAGGGRPGTPGAAHVRPRPDPHGRVAHHASRRQSNGRRAASAARHRREVTSASRATEPTASAPSMRSAGPKHVVKPTTNVCPLHGTSSSYRISQRRSIRRPRSRPRRGTSGRPARWHHAAPRRSGRATAARRPRAPRRSCRARRTRRPGPVATRSCRQPDRASRWTAGATSCRRPCARRSANICRP